MISREEQKQAHKCKRQDVEERKQRFSDQDDAEPLPRSDRGSPERQVLFQIKDMVGPSAPEDAVGMTCECNYCNKMVPFDEIDRHEQACESQLSQNKIRHILNDSSSSSHADSVRGSVNSQG